MKRTVLRMLNDAAKKYANSPYLSQKGNNGWYAKTFKESNQESDYLAIGLMRLGINKSDKISILAEGRIYWVTTEYAILKAGAVSVPLSIKLVPEEILFRINHSESKAIVLSRNSFEKVAPIWSQIKADGFKVIYLDNDLAPLQAILEKHNISPESIVMYDTLLVDGQTHYKKEQAKLQALVDEIKEDDTVTISYTSGTTGNPKGIMLTQLNYFANSNDALNFFKIPEGFRTLIILPLDHSFAHTVGIYIALIKGLSISFVDSRGGSVNTLKNIPINLKEVSPDFLLTVPALSGNFMNKINSAIDEKGGFVKWLFDTGMKAGIRIHQEGYRKANTWVRMLNYIPYKIADKLVFKKVRAIFGENLSFCVGGGALLDIKQQKFFYTLGVPIYQGYGLTEATPIISANTVGIHKLGTSGRLVPGVDCRILSPEGSEMQQGKKGEIVIQGLNVMKGYYKNDKASSEVLKNGWLHTGDLGYMEKDDFLMVVGREKALLISEDGEKYSPEEIEEAIANSSDYIEQVMIYNDHKRYTTAIVTLDAAKVKTLVKNENIQTPSVLMTELKKSFYQFKTEKDYARKFSDKWIPSIFTIADEAFSEENKMINSTMKMVRYKIVTHYQTEINAMYANEKIRVWQKNEEKLNKYL